jgi:hypothetical protein
MSKTTLHFSLPALLALCALALPARAELPIIAKARAYLGSEAALNAVKSVHYVGQFASANPADKAQIAIEIVFQAPCQQRIDAKSDQGVETTALDSYDGWGRLQDKSNPPRWKLQLLGKEQIKRLRASTWQNLAFYRGIERTGGKLVDQGDTTADGIACRKIAFIHADDIIFYRYFDRATGRLVLTESEGNLSIREEGEIVVNGVRFPKVIVNSTKLPDGSTQQIRIAFSQITLNENFPASYFAIPPISPQ